MEGSKIRRLMPEIPRGGGLWRQRWCQEASRKGFARSSTMGGAALGVRQLSLRFIGIGLQNIHVKRAYSRQAGIEPLIYLFYLGHADAVIHGVLVPFDLKACLA